MTVTIIQVDYQDPRQGADLAFLLGSYAADPMGGGEPLDEAHLAALPKALAKLPYALSLLCYVDGQPAGLLNAFEGFSTFKGKPLYNIHDLVVLAPYRGQGLGQQLLSAMADLARAKGCCKLTLEVLDGNLVAKQAYIKAGFAGYQLDPALGQALFWEKQL
ncbi:GNAT family N-acetyltransferase [Gallaecimonas xiamenensis]|uniref:GCN5-related N-acetyltransferase n=1 Tax=Gallaecimonas xiamenensis 3-C-1 TaxID=745411 RepID=K2J034_9GAMM|nr:GNAT family N-acetyltransferase [Gallaecimonas xiamenensis]EKE76196.1 GCN5-related N-acetyltransferase [Gallaecimonas xiamenensis 3-C-1]